MKKVMFLSALIGALLTLALVFTLEYAPNLAQADSGKVWKDAEGSHKPFIDPKINDSMVELVQATLPAVVSIATEQVIKQRQRGRNMDPFDDLFEDFFFNRPNNQPLRQQGLGSGFLINEQGYILTNNHVIENADQITVRLHKGDEYQAKVVGRDERTDVALLKVEPKGKLPYLVLGDSERLEVGHTVVAIGNPFGLSHTVTKGIVSQKGRKDIAPSGRQMYANFIQTDASINPGNSGGPLLNIYGEVVGINTAIAQGAGIGFAIPISMAKTLLPQLANGKIERSWLGIQVQEVTHELADSLGLDKARGALVASVIEGSPAQKAGLQPEDVVLSFDGTEIATYSDLTWYASMAGADKKVSLKVWRNKKEITLDVKLSKMPSDQEMAGMRVMGGNGEATALGVKVADPTKQQLDQLAITDGQGVLVTDVDPNSEAARAGLQPGDMIRKVNQVLVKDTANFIALTSKLNKGDTVRLFVNRQRMALFIAFKVR